MMSASLLNPDSGFEATRFTISEEDFPRVMQPVGKGVVRYTEADFDVYETLAFSPCGEGEHAMVQLRKVGMNTHWLAQKLAEFCDIRLSDVGYAGRKDRHAVTTQWFSCYLPGRQVDWNAFRLQDAEVVAATRHVRKLRKGELSSNRFHLVIRQLQAVHPCHTQDLPGYLDVSLEKIRESGFPNYFGEQRFGREGANITKALQMFHHAGSTRKAGGRRRRNQRNKDIYLSAARALLFNHWLSARLHEGSYDALANDTGPLYGDGDDRSPYPGAQEEGSLNWLLCDGLDSERVKTGRRPVRVLPEAMRWQWKEEADESLSLVLSFSLPPGSYATSMLRELIEYAPGVSSA